jgi:PPM family protein phosphatase
MDWLRRFLGLQPVDEAPTKEQDTTPSTTTSSSAGAAVADTQPSRRPLPNSAADSQSPASTEAATEERIAVDDIADTAETDGRTRQLPPLEAVPQARAGMQFTYGQLSDVGQVRDNNQDSMLCFTSAVTLTDLEPNFGLFVVADGMGGHEHGERASAVATKIITKYVTSDIFLPLLHGETGGDAERPTIIEVLRTAVQEANTMVAEQVPDGGTTVTAAALMGHAAYIAHVGDSRAYLITEDLIEQITRDHSLVQRLIELDQLSPEDAIEHPQRNVLYRAIGQSDSLDVDAIIRQVPPRGYLLICSDGLWNLVTKDEIQQVVLEAADDTQAACRTLVEMANDRGGSDNITVVLVRVPE